MYNELTPVPSYQETLIDFDDSIGFVPPLRDSTQTGVT